MIRSLFSFMSLFSAVAVLHASELSQIERKIAKEPAYAAKPLYTLIAFGRDASSRMWVVADEKTLYVDMNFDGDLTAADEKITPSEKNPADYLVGTITDKSGKSYSELKLRRTLNVLRVSVNVGEKRAQWGGAQMSAAVADAPIVRVGGPLTMHADTPELSRAEETTLYGMMASAGVGKGVLTSQTHGDVAKDLHPVAEIEWPAKAGASPIKQRVLLDHRC